MREVAVYDSEALSQLLRQDPLALARLEVARAKGTTVKVCAITIPEALDTKIRREWLSFVLSRLVVEPVTEAVALQAADLLQEHGLHGHKYAIDAVVATTALRCMRPVAVFTSDTDDMDRFCAEPARPKEERVRIIRV